MPTRGARKQPLSVLEAVGAVEPSAHEEYLHDDWSPPTRTTATNTTASAAARSPPRGRPRPSSTRKKMPSKRSSKAPDESSDEEEESTEEDSFKASSEEDWEDDDDDDNEWEKATKPKRTASSGSKKKRGSSTPRPPPSRQHKKRPISRRDEEDEQFGSSEDEVPAAAATATPDSKPNNKNKKRWSSPPKRSSAVKAERQVAKVLDDNKNDSSSDVASSSSNAALNSKPPARKKVKRSSSSAARQERQQQQSRRRSTARDDDDSDEEFDPEASSESEAELDELVEDEDDGSSVSPDDLIQEIAAKAARKRRSSLSSSSPHQNNTVRRASIGVVRDGDVGTVDDSSDDDNMNGIAMSPQPPQLEIKPSPRRRRRSSNSALLPPPPSSSKRRAVSDKKGKKEESESDGDAPSWSRTAPEDESTAPRCGSTVDIITGEDLPKKHVCFYTPDQQSCQCFSLLTLRKIALSASEPQFRQTNAGRAVQTFLQPPHFRTPMSDDLLDQIASRFGRDALRINGPYYRRSEAIAEPASNWAAVGMPVLPDRHDDGDDAFHDQVRRYIGKTMGSQDLYVCPLCYIVAHSRLKSDGTDKLYETDFSKDPMSVLGYLDNDAFTVSSAFCFPKVAALKEHLRSDHGVATSIVQGNAFYSRYKIREQDGLLQRFLKHESGKNWAPRQGEMMRYWNFGNSDNFLLLLSNIAEADRCYQIVNDRKETDEDALASAQEFLQESTEFMASFADDVPELWETITAPFQKATKEELDFVAYGSDEEDGGADGDELDSYRALNAQAEIAAFHSSQSADEQLAERYKQMAKRDLQERRTGKRDDSIVDGSASGNDDLGESADGRSDDAEDDDNVASDSNDSFQQNIQKKRKVSPRKKIAPQRGRARRETQSTLDRFMRKKREVISVEDDSPSKEDERNRAGSSRDMLPSRRGSKENHQSKYAAAVYDSSSENDAPVLHSASARRKKRLILEDDDNEDSF